MGFITARALQNRWAAAGHAAVAVCESGKGLIAAALRWRGVNKNADKDREEQKSR